MNDTDVRTLADELGQTYFNANKLAPEQVADLFVRNTYLETMTSRDNVLLVGPRGSGKTTLMKMLTRRALDQWSGDLAAQLLAQPVLSIYVGSDTVLRAQLQVPDQVLVGQRALSAFATVRRGKLGLHLVETALAEVSHEIMSGRAILRHDGERAICDKISAIFRLKVVFPTLEALSDAISDALLDFSDAVQGAADGDADKVRRVRDRYRCPSLADVLTQAQAAFSGGLDGLPDKWILLFDEIEYLPDSSREEILQLIRSLGPSFGLKIALTPLSITSTYLTEVEKSFLHAGHDFLPLSLSSGSTKEVLEFSEALVASLLQRLAPRIGGLPEAFGISVFADPAVSKKYPSSLQVSERLADQDLVDTLAEAQPRFKQYAERFSLLNGGLASLSPAQRASRYRKALPVMQLWMDRLKPVDELHEPGSPYGRRGRKVHHIYAGYPTVLLLADGNPRVLMGILNRLLRSSRDAGLSSPTGHPYFRVEWQDAAIEGARKEQLALANAYLSTHGRVVGDLFAIDLINELGLMFEENVHLSARFNPDPATTFVVDDGLDGDLSQAIVDAYYTGILVGLDPVNDRSLLRPKSSLIGTRFRLSYLQGTHYWLPARKGRQVNLSTLVDRLSVGVRVEDRTSDGNEQGSMF